MYSHAAVVSSQVGLQLAVIVHMCNEVPPIKADYYI